ncbi:MAG: hypothetical protein [Caudoviricetes sp.]|nr:MAG: hypothetical protein [Caudoviricetes sp.]
MEGTKMKFKDLNINTFFCVKKVEDEKKIKDTGKNQTSLLFFKDRIDSCRIYPWENVSYFPTGLKDMSVYAVDFPENGKPKIKGFLNKRILEI